MSTDPTAPLPDSEPDTQAHPPIDPWAAAPHTAPLPVTPPTAPFPVTPSPGTPAAFPATAAPQTAPTAQFPATPVPSAGPFAAPPTQLPPPAPFSGPPAQFSAPPVPFAGAPAQFSAPPAPFSGPPAQFSGPPAQAAGAWPAVGPYPPVSMPAHPVPAGFAAAGPEVVAVQIAEITVSPPIIRTPAGVLPLAGASWHVADYWQREEKIATWALVCAIVGFFCLAFFSLLFLLVKETRHHGTVQVTVTNGAQQYVARIPVTDQGQVQHLNNQVNYARALSSR
ncbi:hypothetical protein [Micromonospora sp. U21]|uniref:hypothetical protein n=1 Tax=Micromonospora sp. U21 TaxID=2824899 RepID=UPI001B38BE6C|nr:hypothetical protein [Micromonospora sp. U21]MBQ0901926.1 hypothetical protein [Micromonospora sp. U21]